MASRKPKSEQNREAVQRAKATNNAVANYIKTNPPPGTKIKDKRSENAARQRAYLDNKKDTPKPDPTGSGTGSPAAAVEKPKPTPPPPAVPPKPAVVKESEKVNNKAPLRYPKEAIEEGQDFIKFDILTYRRGGLVTKSDENLKGDLLGTIILPIPSQISDNNTANFGPGNINFMEAQGIQAASSIIQAGGAAAAFSETAAAGKNAIKMLTDNNSMIAKYFATEAVNALGGNVTLDQLLARSSGEVINPNMELLFSGPGLRQFKFSFKFTPRFSNESDEVKKIIKAFKRNMAPKGSGGNFLRTPNIFQINYMQGSGEHPFLNKFKLCALTNMSVNYTGDGVHATYIDGTPISMIMDLSFSELTPIYNEDYNEIDEFGPGHLGVGY